MMRALARRRIAIFLAAIVCGFAFGVPSAFANDEEPRGIIDGR